MKQREPQVIGLGAEQRYDRRTQVDNQEGKTNGIEGDFIKTKNAKNRLERMRSDQYFIISPPVAASSTQNLGEIFINKHSKHK